MILILLTLIFLPVIIYIAAIGLALLAPLLGVAIGLGLIYGIYLVLASLVGVQWATIVSLVLFSLMGFYQEHLENKAKKNEVKMKVNA